MNSVAAKIAIEIGVLFQHDDIDAGARQQKACHHSGGSAANNYTTGSNFRQRVHKSDYRLTRAAPQPSPLHESL
jgi:hypothetical protein